MAAFVGCSPATVDPNYISEGMRDSAVLLADETTYIEDSVHKQIVIISNNEEVSNIIINHFMPSQSIEYEFIWAEDVNRMIPQYTMHLWPKKKQELLNLFKSRH